MKSLALNIRPINPETELPAVVDLLNGIEKDPITTDQFSSGSSWKRLDAFANAG